MEKNLSDGGNKTAEDRFDLMFIHKIPFDLDERRTLSLTVTQRVLDVFAGRLSQAEHTLFRTEPLSSPKSLNLWPKFDETLISEASSLGWRILLSDDVLRRVEHWHDWLPEGPELLKRFFGAIVTSSRMRRGLEQHPLTAPELYPSRQLARDEMKALCKRLNALTVGRARLPETTRLYTLIRDEINATGRYPYLRKNIRSLFNYLGQQDEDHGRNFTKQLVVRGSGVTPAEIINGWFDWAFCTAEGQSRKIISKIGSRKHL